MQLISFDRKKGIMKVIPKNIDDLWVLYNVINKNDQVFARSTRVIKVEEEAARPTKGRRVSMFIGICVDSVTFQREMDRLRIHGIVIEAPERYGIMGSHHTINIPLRRPMTISKEVWLNHDIERIRKASKIITHPIIVVSIDGDECCIALLQQHGIDIKAEIRAKLPSKRDVEKRGPAISKYFKTILQVLDLVWKNTQGLLSIIGPGFWKEDLVKYIRIEQPKLFGVIKAVRTVGNGGIAGVKEAIRSGVLDKVAKEGRVIEETKVVNEVLSRLGANQDKVTYGQMDVENAINTGAVKLLLVADELLRKERDEERKSIEDLMRKVEKIGGRIMIINTKFEAGKQLVGLGGLAALLRYSIT
ncbi:mRNA surveillance protein pelota [Candidatus Bathyarchaeota archaeon]|nr:mRNA surveillance protein pelota [Candidatus Bathyarchaeota archaeon]